MLRIAREEEKPVGGSPSDDELPEGALDPVEILEPAHQVPPKVIPPDGVASASKPPASYWQAAISELPPLKQAAAWEFFQEHELGVARGGTDTLSGMMLLMEANGLFMDACAQRLFTSAATVVPAVGDHNAAKTLTPVVELIRGELTGMKRELLTQITDSLALYRVDMAKSDQSAPPPMAAAPRNATMPPDAAPTASLRAGGRKYATWFFAGLLALAVGGAGVYFGDLHARRTADQEMESRVGARMSQIKTWLDTEQEAKAVLMSRKATLSFDFARDPSRNDHKVYTLTVKGVPIVRAGTTKEGTGVIAFESNVPDLFAP